MHPSFALHAFSVRVVVILLPGLRCASPDPGVALRLPQAVLFARLQRACGGVPITWVALHALHAFSVLVTLILAVSSPVHPYSAQFPSRVPETRLHTPYCS